MKKFSDFNRFRKINEQEITLQNQPENQGEQQSQQSAQSQSSPSQDKQDLPFVVEKEPTPETPKTEGSAVKFFSKLLESREMAQVYHWTVKGDQGSHAAHLALEAYYDGVIEYIDDMVEVYQGQYELLEGYDVIDTSETKSKDKVEYFQGIAQYIKENRNVSLSAEDTHIQNIVDEVIALVYKTIYKLKYNK
jgi:DNA-binding ferritin-like protein